MQYFTNILTIKVYLSTAGKRPDLAVEMGFNDFSAMQTNDIGELDPLENFGKGKCCEGGPTCEFRGKEIPTFAQWSDSGGITPTILTNILRYLDSLHIFDRSGGKRPFLLLDGHTSRHSLEFVKYVTDPAHPWCVQIGVPYGTSLWQVADSPEQNGRFKIVWSDEKAKLLQKKWTMVCLQSFPHWISYLCSILLFKRHSIRLNQTGKQLRNVGGFHSTVSSLMMTFL
jgi:hypothetical protein